MTHDMTGTAPPSDTARRLAMLGGPLARRLAGHRWFSFWGLVRHVGRASGRRYAVPVVVRRAGDAFVIPLPFGERTQWVRNLASAGGGGVRWNGREYTVGEPHVVELEDVAASFRTPERAIMRRVGARFVRLPILPG